MVVLDVDTFTGDAGALVRFLEPSWMRDALCREHPEVSWFPERGEPSAPAKAVCRRCAVRAECLDYALGDPDLAGIWGATSPQERARRGLDDEHARHDLLG